MVKKQKTQRKHAQQARSKQTIRTILEATAQVLKQHGRARLTTNHIAAKAGISVGSIYQYFPNKEAILFQLMREQLDHATAQRPSILDAGAGITLSERITAVVRWHLDMQREDPLLAQRLHELRSDILSSEQSLEFDRFHEERVWQGLQFHKKEIAQASLRTKALVVSQLLLAATQVVPASRPQVLVDPEYEAQLVSAVLTYLRT